MRETYAVLWFYGGQKLLKIWWGLKLWDTCNPSYIPRVVVETTLSDEIAFHVNWVFTKVLLVLYFVGSQIA